MSLRLRSTKQIYTLQQARLRRHSTSDELNFFLPQDKNISPETYCLAALSEGLGETQCRRFLSKLNIPPPSKSEFYEAQNNLFEKIEKISQKSLQFIREQLTPDTVFGLDCSWSSKRNAAHSIVIFMDMKTHLIFDKVIVSRNKEVSDLEFYGPSNMMEYAAVRSKCEEYKSNYKFVGFVHDFDVNTYV